MQAVGITQRQTSTRRKGLSEHRARAYGGTLWYAHEAAREKVYYQQRVRRLNANLEQSVEAQLNSALPPNVKESGQEVQFTDSTVLDQLRGLSRQFSNRGNAVWLANIPASTVLYAGMVMLDFGIKRFGLEAFLQLCCCLGLKSFPITTDSPDSSGVAWCPLHRCSSRSRLAASLPAQAVDKTDKSC